MFDPLHLTKAASLNRTPLADLPGAEQRLVGRRAFELLRLEALHRLAAEHGILADRRTEVPRRLRAALGSAASAEANRAQEVVAEFGRRLGHLVATLRLGADDSSQWRTAYVDDSSQWRTAYADDSSEWHTVYNGAAEWRAAYRRHWRSVERVWLGGGVVAALGNDLLQAARAEAGRLGVDAARAERRQLGRDDSTLNAAPHADVLALVGAARTRATPAPRAIVLDFGYSSVKRGIAHFSQGGALQRLDVLRGSPWHLLVWAGRQRVIR